jgi:hypothetical protein
VTAAQFTPESLTGDLQPDRAGTRPRILLLADVPHLTPVQQAAVEQFLQQGGSVLVMFGRRIGDPASYNQQLFRGGQGWLPAELERVTVRADAPEQAAGLAIQEAQHPALAAFHKSAGAFGAVRFPQYWRVRPAAGGKAVTAAVLTSGDAFLVEKPTHAGRVILWTVPPDGAWDSNLPRAWEFPVLIHQLVYYLAASESANDNVAAVATADRRESDLTALSEQDRKEIARHVPLQYEDDPHTVAQAVIDPAHQEDLWWLLLLFLMAVLCGEIWLTRGLALQRGS